jgi:hypothetical protein
VDEDVEEEGDMVEVVEVVVEEEDVVEEGSGCGGCGGYGGDEVHYSTTRLHYHL